MTIPDQDNPRWGKHWGQEISPITFRPSSHREVKLLQLRQSWSIFHRRSARIHTFRLAFTCSWPSPGEKATKPIKARFVIKKDWGNVYDLSMWKRIFGRFFWIPRVPWRIDSTAPRLRCGSSWPSWPREWTLPSPRNSADISSSELPIPESRVPRSETSWKLTLTESLKNPKVIRWSPKPHSANNQGISSGGRL